MATLVLESRVPKSRFRFLPGGLACRAAKHLIINAICWGKRWGEQLASVAEPSHSMLASSFVLSA